MRNPFRFLYDAVVKYRNRNRSDRGASPGLRETINTAYRQAELEEQLGIGASTEAPGCLEKEVDDDKKH